MTSGARSNKRTAVVRGSRATNASSALNTNTIGTFDAVTTMFARNPLDAVRAASDKGYADGLEAARQDVETATDDANKRVRRAVAALSEASLAFEQRETAAMEDLENEIVNAAFAIARAVLQRELTVATDPGAEAIARALTITPGREAVVARLNPDDVATLNMTNVATAGRDIEVLADATVEPGGCIIETPQTSIDAQLSTALANVAVALNLG